MNAVEMVGRCMQRQDPNILLPVLPSGAVPSDASQPTRGAYVPPDDAGHPDARRLPEGYE